MEMQVPQKFPPIISTRLTNRVITWAIRDMTPIKSSGYRGNLGSLIVDKRPNYETT